MPNFIVSMAIRYLLVSLAITVGITGFVTVLMTYGYMLNSPSSLAYLVVMGSGIWAGTYYAKQTGRRAEWRECFRISAVLTVVQLILSAVLSLGIKLLPGGGFDDLTSNMSPGLLGLLAALLVFIGLIYWVATAAFLRMGSKSALKAKKT
jgi:hypothetical protein